MIPADFVARYAALQEADDHEGFARFLAQYPELVQTDWAQSEFLAQATRGNAAFVRVFLDAGMDANLAHTLYDADRVLFDAVSGGSSEVVRLLLERGAEPNWD